MGIEQMHEFGSGMLGCSQLDEEGVFVTENSVAAEFPVVVEEPSLPQESWQLADQLVVGMEGTCLTGQRGECPKGHNCGRVKVSMPAPPLYVEVEPIEVKNDQS